MFGPTLWVGSVREGQLLLPGGRHILVSAPSWARLYMSNYLFTYMLGHMVGPTPALLYWSLSIFRFHMCIDMLLICLVCTHGLSVSGFHPCLANFETWHGHWQITN